MRRRSTVGAAALAAAALGVACTNECPTLEACDIRRPTCQQLAAAVAACHRGGTTPSPVVEVVDAQTFIDEQVRAATEVPETPDERAFRTGLTLFSLAPWDYDPGRHERTYWDTVGAFYSSVTRRVTVLDRGSPMDSPGMAILLVHEMIHAMQYEDLGEAYYHDRGNTYDSDLAFSAMEEGEATLYQDLATVEGFHLDPDDVPWSRVFRTFQADSYATFAGDDYPYALARRRFPYAYGGGYVSSVWRSGGSAAVRAIFANVPTTTREVLAYPGADPPGGRGWVDGPDEVGVPILPASFGQLATRHLGAWLVDAFRAVWGKEETSPTSFRDVGFSGDVLTIFRNPTAGDVTGIWRLRFDDAGAATRFADGLLSRSWMSARVEERDVVLVASTDESVAATLPDSIAGWTSAPEVDWTRDPAPGAAAARATRPVHVCVGVGVLGGPER